MREPIGGRDAGSSQHRQHRLASVEREDRHQVQHTEAEAGDQRHDPHVLGQPTGRPAADQHEPTEAETSERSGQARQQLLPRLETSGTGC
jgi:hypothetical protein